MQPQVFDQLGLVQSRTGNRSVNNAPRNAYRTRDEQWVAISTSAHSIAERVMHLVGHPEVIDEPWFAAGSTRAQHADLLDGYVGDWIGARDMAEVVDAFERAQAAVAPIYDIADVFADPQYQALDRSRRSTTPTSVRCACRTCSSGSRRRPEAFAGRVGTMAPTPGRCSPSSSTSTTTRSAPSRPTGSW